MTAPTTRETANHAELARLAEAAEPYWHAANLACGGNPIAVDLVAPFVGAMSPAVCSALLSEIAALRGERASDDHAAQAEVDEHAGKALDWEIVAGSWKDRATQAERQRDEAVGLLRELADGRSQKNNINEYDDLSGRASTLLANQGADG